MSLRVTPTQIADAYILVMADSKLSSTFIRRFLDKHPEEFVNFLKTLDEKYKEEKQQEEEKKNEIAYIYLDIPFVSTADVPFINIIKCIRNIFGFSLADSKRFIDHKMYDGMNYCYTEVDDLNYGKCSRKKAEEGILAFNKEFPQYAGCLRWILKD
jgi:ribosomal protein L7/L12